MSRLGSALQGSNRIAALGECHRVSSLGKSGNPQIADLAPSGCGTDFSAFCETGDMENQNTGRHDDTAIRKNMDIQDSERDKERLKKDEAIIDLPEVRDIPGQEHVHVPSLGELADVTISSDDEEGAGILDDLNDEDDAGIRMGTEADLTANDRSMLETGDNFHTTQDENNLRRATMDSTDFEGDRLNEASFGEEQSGSDLDIPISETDDANESIGEEDEENNAYSLGSDRNDQVVEGTL